MGHTQSRSGVLIGAAAAVGAFGAAAMISAATAPTARADDFTQILDNVQTTLGVGQTELTGAEADFATGLSGVPQGLEQFESFLNNDLVSTEEDLIVGTLNAESGDPVGLGFSYGYVSAPTDIADAVSLAQSVVTSEGETNLADAATSFAAGDYAVAAYDYLDGSFATYVFPAEVIFVGAVDQLLGL